MTQECDTMTTEEKPAPTKRKPIIIKAVHKLKIKTGPGGFDQRNIMMARKRLAEAAHMFPAVAAQDLTMLDEALLSAKSGADSIETKQRILAACTEIKAHSVMFQFPLVAEIAESLILFCDNLKMYSDVAYEVIAEYLKALRIAIGEGPRAITPHDRDSLLQDLSKATDKVLRNQ